MTPHFSRRRRAAVAVAATAVAATLAGSFFIRADASTTSWGTQVARYTFDDPDAGSLLDLSGHRHVLAPVSGAGGAVATIPRGDGVALTFPAACHEEPCPRVALRARSSEDLNPGKRLIRFGASVLLAPDQTTKGQNVLQKGYSARGSQYKLQIDGLAGKPSCALVDGRTRRVHIAKSSITVADNAWHSLECRRKRSMLVIRVDGERRGSTRIPADLSVSNRNPLSVGGKGAYTDNDQFQGALDDVWVAIA
ncbi:LamG domain-containing protein [Couchioplanes caeruleus]|uniref:LamG-like jellyroll fold domain-containing protein n=1 Tax=Couchioplanes caeruleus TaxID=56438 RepID=UPI0020BDDF63|nr:LamG-like jellyroll fold domain-containing protein [Couchioplanes caeruleus]UQU65741.1 LamG domain-containing protein [Couchioplanes caeruleus]